MTIEWLQGAYFFVAVFVMPPATLLSTLYLLWSNYREKRLTTLSARWKMLRSPTGVKACYRIDYEENWYDQAFHGSPEETEMDEYLTSLAFVCFLKKRGDIGENEMNVFSYELDRTLKNPQVIDYLYNLHHYSKASGGKSPFDALEAYARTNGYLATNIFDDKDAHFRDGSYHNYLGW